MYNCVHRATLTVQEGAVLGTQKENLEGGGEGRTLNVLPKIFHASLSHRGGVLLNVTRWLLGLAPSWICKLSFNIQIFSTAFHILPNVTSIWPYAGKTIKTSFDSVLYYFDYFSSMLCNNYKCFVFLYKYTVKFHTVSLNSFKRQYCNYIRGSLVCHC